MYAVAAWCGMAYYHHLPTRTASFSSPGTVPVAVDASTALCLLAYHTTTFWQFCHYILFDILHVLHTHTLLPAASLATGHTNLFPKAMPLSTVHLFPDLPLHFRLFCLTQLQKHAFPSYPLGWPLL